MGEVGGEQVSSDWRNHNRRFIQPLLPDFLNSFSIPRSFVKQHLHLECDLEGDEHTHTVVLMCDDHPHRHWLVSLDSRRFFFTLGWNDFCNHLDLHIGDFLLFTYLSHFLFHVTVFDPASACQRPFPSSPTPPSNTTPFTSLVTLTSYNFHNSILFLPVGFVRQHGLQYRRCDMLIIDAEKRTWNVTLNYKKSDGQSYIKRGWKPFLRANRLNPGNVVCLQFLKPGTCPTLKCFRTTNIIGEESNTACKTAPQKALPQDVTTRPFEQDPSQYLSCHVRLGSYSIEKSIIYLPTHFARQSHLQGRKCEVKIVDEKERTWKVGLGFKRSRSNSYLCRGWRDVQNANCFRRGDVLCFHLLRAGEQPMLKCYRPNNTGEESNGTYKTIPKKALAGDVTTSSFEKDRSQY